MMYSTYLYTHTYTSVHIRSSQDLKAFMHAVSDVTLTSTHTQVYRVFRRHLIHLLYLLPTLILLTLTKLRCKLLLSYLIIPSY